MKLIESIDTIQAVLDLLKQGEVVITKAPTTHLCVMEKENIRVSSLTSNYLLTPEDFVYLFQKQTFFIYESKDQDYKISQERDEEYYSWRHK